MDLNYEAVQKHYGRDDLLRAVLAALREAGKDPEQLTPADLAPVDEFHLRGRDATVELANRAGVAPGLDVLDVGCGLGGSARYLASEHRCRVTGVDLTPQYVAVARVLTEKVGLGASVHFHEGSALDLPVAGQRYDVVWTEHAQMNIADKAGFYREITGVLAAGGRLAFHDIFAGEGDPYFPVPWAPAPAISHLAPPDEARALVEGLGLRAKYWEDITADSRAWFRAMLERVAREGRPPLGLHLLMGPSAKEKFDNVLRSLDESRIRVVQAVFEKPASA